MAPSRLRQQVQLAEEWNESELTVVPSGEELELKSGDLEDYTDQTPIPTRVGGLYGEDTGATRVDAYADDDSVDEPEIEIIEEASDPRASKPYQAMDDATRRDTPLPPNTDRPTLERPTQERAIKKIPARKLPLTDQTIEEPARARKAAFAPTVEQPVQKAQQPDTRPEHVKRPERGDRTLVRRLVDSVVAALPKSVRKSVTKEVSLPKGSAATQAGVDARAWRELRTAPIFDGLPNEALRDALLTGDAAVMKLERDQLVPLDGAVALVKHGQLALGQFAEEVLRAERKAAQQREPGQKGDKKERKRRAEVGPLIVRAARSLATFEEGDVVETSTVASQHAQLACYTVTPAQVVTLSRARLDLWRRIYPFIGDRFRRAGNVTRAKMDAVEDGAKALVADFFIRHGLSVSMTLRVRKLDSCIECGACEQACEDRYGVKRLSLNGRILGGLDFVDACHTCTDQRCVDPCNFDAISFDAERKEVLINEANCTGCTLCAVACPYNAIEMHELDDKPGLKLRLDRDGKLAFGEGAGRKAKLRRIASKCDHCAFYNDQACVSACPTGALLEILPSDAVTQLPDQARAVAKAGFDRTAAIDLSKLNQTRAFVKGFEKLPELGRARAPRAKIMVGLWWAVGALAVLAFGVEIALRKLMPQWSLMYLMAVHVDGIDPELALGRVDYRPGCALAVNLGYTGTALLCSTMVYVWRRRFSFMRNWGSLRSWFDWHVMAGVIGPLFILMHTAAKLDNWVSMAFWSMILTVVSGLLGRYLTTQIEENASVAAVETLEESRALDELRRLHVGVRTADDWFEAYRTRVQKFERGFKNGAPTFFGAVWACLWVAGDDLLRGSRIRQLKRRLRDAVRGHKAWSVRRKATRHALKLALLERRRVLLPRLEPLFRQWKAVHVPMAICLTVIATIHIVLALRAG
jgi:Fe-S-cluster-containing hydrogenase component 2